MTKSEQKDLPVLAGTALEAVDWGVDAGAGAEDVGADEQLTPILRVLHYQCPQIDEDDPGYVPGARPGNIFNIATQELWDGKEGLDVVVCGRKKHYGEWLPRGDGGGGGFRGFHDQAEPIVQELLSRHGQFKPLPWTNDAGEDVQLVETGEMFVLYSPPPLSHDNARRAILSFTSKSLATYKGYNTRHAEWRFPQADGSRRPGPVWAYRWRLRSLGTSNKLGKFFIWTLDLAPPANGPIEALIGRQDPELFLMAKESSEQYRRGNVRYKAEQATTVNPNDPPF